jgi:predicted PurR-regulated permease PerM
MISGVRFAHGGCRGGPVSEQLRAGAADETAEAREQAAQARDEAIDARAQADSAREVAEASAETAVSASQEAEESADGAVAARLAAEQARDEAVAVIDRGDDPILDEEARHREAGVDEDNPFGRLGRPMSRRSPFRVGFSATIGVGCAYLLYRAVVNAQSVLVLVLVAAFLAIGLNPTVSRLERLGMRRGGAVAVVFLGVLLFFAVVGYAILPPLVEQGTTFISKLPAYVSDLQKNATIDDLDRRFGVIDKVNAYLTSSDLSRRAAQNVLSIGSTIAGIIFKILTILILTLYFLSSFNAITHTAYRMVPRSRRARVTLLGDEILSRVGGYVAGAFLVALVAGTASLVWLSSLGVPYPLALALVVMITDIIPLVGATIGAIAVTVITLLISLPVGIATGIFFIVYQQIENYLIYPRVMKRSVDVNPAAAIVGALVGGTLLGIVGALLAVPATAAIQLILREVLLPRQEAA